MKIKVVVFLVFCLMILASGCQEETSDEVGVCGETDLVKEETDHTGVIYYHSEEVAYAIYSSIEGTIDSQDVGILCSLEEEYQVDGQ
ncbi:hypothetical protein [Reichenbachiella sp. MSK19-1]|uniref:hypothetical protein n=1 Tax=Reichenbachiella sp. MSK19-1 TaxID=1897631 RepID=UPI0011C43DE8|nr:hypothetical protein [Reichenbachiella sp. MSK19-1]